MTTSSIEIKKFIQGIADNADKCGLFGSTVNGTQTPTSDIDVFAVVNTEHGYKKITEYLSQNLDKIFCVRHNGYSGSPVRMSTGIVDLTIFNNQNDYQEFLNFDNKSISLLPTSSF